MTRLYYTVALVAIIGGWATVSAAQQPAQPQRPPGIAAQCEDLMFEVARRRAYFWANIDPIKKYGSLMESSADPWIKRASYGTWFAAAEQAIIDGRAITAMVRVSPECFLGAVPQIFESHLAEVEQKFATANNWVKNGGLR